MLLSATALVAALALSAVHWGARYLTLDDRVPRNAWLSAASGVSVAYVFVQLLPEVAAVQVAISETDAAGALPYLEAHAWLLALVGLSLFYGLEVHAQHVRARRGGASTTDVVGALHLGGYAVYNAVIGYLLLQQAEQGPLRLLLFAVAIGLHMLVNDSSLRDHHGQLYHDVGRWVLGAAVLAGWALSVVTDLSEAAVGLPLALISGAIVLNVMKEELPTQRESRVLPFLLGAAGYSALLLAL
ncbi:hypothetical protein BH23ACT9_BH23ACT9_39680 [soil metagenome]